MNIPFVDNSKMPFNSIGVGMFKYAFLMGTFPLPPPICYIDSVPMSVLPVVEMASEILLVENDPWI